MSKFRDQLKYSIVKSILEDKTPEEVADTILDRLFPKANDQIGIVMDFVEMASVSDEQAMIVAQVFTMGRVYEQSHPNSHYKEIIDVINKLTDYIRHGKEFDEEVRELVSGISEKLHHMTMREIEETKIESLKDAVKVLCEALVKDGGYRQGWKANIAMAVYDTIMGDDDLTHISETIHDYCNKGAEKFLKTLCSNN